jgi:hypothetical protein
MRVTLIVSKTVLRLYNALGISRLLATLAVQTTRQGSCDGAVMHAYVNTSKRLRHNERSNKFGSHKKGRHIHCRSWRTR